MSEQIPREITDDLCTRFLNNLSDNIAEDEIQLMFQIELAYWYYLDFCVEDNPALPKLNMPTFVEILNRLYPRVFASLPNGKSMTKICTTFNQYKLSCHTVGAILLNKDYTKCLLVQNYNLPSTWEFPKGKQLPGEEFTGCAIREVQEETGFDITPHLDPSAYIEHIIFDRYNRHYMIAGISEATAFQPQTRNEIRSVTWFYIDDLPRYRNDQRSKRNINLSPHLFFKIVPLMKELLEWVDYLNNSINRPIVVHSNSLTPKHSNPTDTQHSCSDIKHHITPPFYSQIDKQKIQPRFSPSQSAFLEPLETTSFSLPERRFANGRPKPDPNSVKSPVSTTITEYSLFSQISFSSILLTNFSFDRNILAACFD
ncbi:M7GpppN-mRNA hydrolase [Oopsacas minuta]|uniref:mRNA-decapping enzyme 2 n=1 Tax=Oopsacas minuta TaxID=111878 RepID=A0AAV7JR68_9METZ|nr:M7GpppN-mRNA hydrolase [Oopsacas minuta]